MNLKYFYYISKTKVEMLLPQLWQKRFLIPKIKPKIEVAGVSIEAEINKQKDESLVANVLELIDEMGRRDFIKDMGNTTQLDTETYYHSDKLWHHGVFYFRGGVPKFWGGGTHNDEAFICYGAYFAWCTFNNSIVLLSGSPTNILGEVIAKEGIFIPGTSGVERAVGELVSSISLSDTDAISWIPSQTVPADIKNYYTNEYGFRHATYDGRIFDQPTSIFFSPSSISEPLPYAVFCLKYLGNLPERKVDTVFKVFSKSVSSKSDYWEDLIAMYKRSSSYLRDYEKEFWETTLSEAEQIKLKDYNTVYLGSPIYTALI